MGALVGCLQYQRNIHTWRYTKYLQIVSAEVRKERTAFVNLHLYFPYGQMYLYIRVYIYMNEKSCSPFAVHTGGP
jgi:hypothetical protein